MTWNEDRASIFAGFIILFFSVLFYFIVPISESQDFAHQDFNGSSFKTIEVYQAEDAIKPSDNVFSTFLNKMKVNTQTWQNNPLKAFYFTEKPEKTEKFDKLSKELAISLAQAIEYESIAKKSDFKNEVANVQAKSAIGEWRLLMKKVHDSKPKPEVHPLKILVGFGLSFLLLALLFGFTEKLVGNKIFPFIKGFLFVFAVALLSYVISSQSQLKTAGLGYALWSIVLGIFISNAIGIPDWVKPGLKHELFIKTGLVLLGTEILFSKILAIGLPGIFVAWVVTPIVLVATYWFGQKYLKIGSKSLNMTISADMSVCGVSAAIATAAACNAKKEELTTAIGLSMAFTSIMMVVMPIFIKAVGMPEVLGGAWIGGTIDATGAVVAAGAFLGEKALSVAATVKMIQNILIGVIAFGVAIYWTTKVDKQAGVKISWKEIWYRFPKFILGFIVASILFSLLYKSLSSVVAQAYLENSTLVFIDYIKGLLFCLAFVSIGLSTNFKELKVQFKGGKPLILYLVGQTFNLILTLLVAWLVFYKIFPDVTANI